MKSQGNTPLCWSVALTGLLEAHVLNKKRLDVSFSDMYLWYHFVLMKAPEIIQKKEVFYLFPDDLKTDIIDITRLVEKVGVIPSSEMPIPKVKTGILKGQLKAAIEKLRFETWEKKYNFKVFKEKLTQILDRILGKPPATFSVDEQEFNPGDYYKKTIGLPRDAYILVRHTNNPKLLNGPHRCSNLEDTDKNKSGKVGKVCYSNKVNGIILKSLGMKICPYISWIYSKPIHALGKSVVNGYFSFKGVRGYYRRRMERKYFKSKEGIKNMVKASWGRAGYDSYLSFSHACTVVGYDKLKGIFLCKNTWGKYHKWTDKGYFYMDKGFTKRFVFEILTIKKAFKKNGQGGEK